MKLKLWQLEYEFDRDDAKVVIPIILLLLAISFTTLNPILLLGTAAVYYLLYFFLMDVLEIVNAYIAKARMRCPECKNRKIFLQGYQSYKSDEEHPYYYCDHCKTTSILTNGGLLKI